MTDVPEPIEDGQRAENCFVFGPSGAGKMSVVSAVVRKLRPEVLDIPHAYVNCGYSLYGVSALPHPQPDYGLLIGVGTVIRYGVPVGAVSSTVAFGLRRFSPTQPPVAEKKQQYNDSSTGETLGTAPKVSCTDHIQPECIIS